MSKVLLIGSGNAHKAEELATLLAGLPWEVRSLKDFPAVEEPEETGETFEENALLKARYYGRHFGVACVADDSGLCVDALGGAPGVYSARYAGPDCTYDDNNEKLLDELEEYPWHQRTARFVCCAAFLEPGGEPQVFRGEVEGHISVEACGEAGFGYDPLFVPSGEERTFAEMTAKEKHALSHRGRAFAQLRAYLESH
ncbi:MAG: RdgB/HAM1 family non-canonical purine NTP pyrophosphatase [Candidatus Hydrogenedens sp.]|nr:RdgB/HAM1 family non-canonical purine NTP pyrophosphatase [Candidatus Hydrogenedens sp.]